MHRLLPVTLPVHRRMPLLLLTPLPLLRLLLMALLLRHQHLLKHQSRNWLEPGDAMSPGVFLAAALRALDSPAIQPDFLEQRLNSTATARKSL